MESAARLRLDPLKKQVVPIVFNKRELDANTGRWGNFPYLTLITTIDGYRAIADRTGNYRPDNKTPRYMHDESAKNPDTNPLSIVSCEVSVFKFAHGEWHEHPAIAYWDEYVPLKKVGRNGKPSNEGLQDEGDAGDEREVIDWGTQWGRRPRGQIAKCAEALALRRAWPEDLSGTYIEEEMDRAKIVDGEYVDVTASEAAENAAVERRLDAARAKDTILFDWGDASPLSPVPLGQVADRCLAFIRHNDGEPSVLGDFQVRNRHSLREFWAKSPNDANAVKKAFEDAIEKAKRHPETAA
jgi:phage recombination protein Bet